MANYDWSKFTKRISIKSSVKKVYEAWTTRKNLEGWFLRKAEFTKTDGSLRESTNPIEPGDSYEWMWHGYDDSVKENGLVKEVNGMNRLRFTFAKCDVTVTITSEGDECICELKQENIPTDEESKVRLHLGCTEGWTFYLANLKSILEGGLDLRNKKMQKQQVVNS